MHIICGCWGNQENNHGLVLRACWWMRGEHTIQSMLNYRVCGVSWRHQPESRINPGPGQLREILLVLRTQPQECVRSTSQSAPSTSPSSPLPLPPSPVLKSYSNDFMFWNLQWFIWICGFLGPTPLLSLQKKYQSTQAQQGHKLGIVTLLIHKLRRRACYGCLYKICEFEPVMPFFDIFCMHFWAFEVSFKANGLSEQLVPNINTCNLTVGQGFFKEQWEHEGMNMLNWWLGGAATAIPRST